MQLRDIEYFAVVAEHGNLRRAAESLGLSQPALSKSLRRLEKSMAAKLVKRTPKGVELTTVGTALNAQVRRIRLTLDDVAREAADLSQGRAGQLRIGASPVHAEELPAAYAALLKDAPNVKVAITVSDNDLMVPALRSGELDLIVNYIDDFPYEGCVKEHLYDDEVVVYSSADHPLTKQKIVTMAQIARQRWALSPVNLLPWHSFYRAFQDKGVPLPQATVETRSLRLRVQTVASSDLLGFLSRRVIRQAAPQFRLKELHVKEVKWRRPVGVIYRKDAYLSPAARRFIEILKATVREINRAPASS
jgi:DNA-binding transcriptional LysR family regulator